MTMTNHPSIRTQAELPFMSRKHLGYGLRVEVVGFPEFRQQYSKILEAAGARVTMRIGMFDGNVHCILSDSQPSLTICQTAQRLKLPVFNVAWLCECVMAGYVVLPRTDDEIKRYTVVPPPVLKSYVAKFEEFFQSPTDKNLVITSDIHRHRSELPVLPSQHSLPMEVIVSPSSFSPQSQLLVSPEHDKTKKYFSPQTSPTVVSHHHQNYNERFLTMASPPSHPQQHFALSNIESPSERNTFIGGILENEKNASVLTPKRIIKFDDDKDEEQEEDVRSVSFSK
jgi:hypothetical protein